MLRRKKERKETGSDDDAFFLAGAPRPATSEIDRPETQRKRRPGLDERRCYCRTVVLLCDLQGRSWNDGMEMTLSTGLVRERVWGLEIEKEMLGLRQAMMSLSRAKRVGPCSVAWTAGTSWN